jgi:heme/copper-type cytochrome/quinol oxidase subunit 2
MTEATEIYDTCKTAIAAKAELVQTRKTWLLVVIVLSAIIIIVMLILTCFHQNNKRKDKKMNVSINNNTGEKSVSQGEMEVATDKLLKETRS